MTSLDIILREVESLPSQDLRTLLHILVDKMLFLEREWQINDTQTSKNPFEKYRGIAKGVWNQDAQEYVNQLREDREF